MSSDKLERAGQLVIRYGLVLALGWIGAMKFTAYEAQAIQPLVANSPLMSWVYQIFSVAPGQFLLKDVVLLGAAIWSLGEALKSAYA